MPPNPALLILFTLTAGVGSVLVAAALSRILLDRYQQLLLSFAAGALLATALLHLLPEAFEAEWGAYPLFLAFLLGLLFFFLLDKAELWHHGHEHGVINTHHKHIHNDKASGTWSVLFGDSVHCFGDGILIASAFLADMHLGLITATAVFMHEVPHHIGDLSVLGQGKHDHHSAALIKLCLAGSFTILGGIAGYFLLGFLDVYLPFVVVLAASSFIYVALADLIPQLQKRVNRREFFLQMVGLFGGLIMVASVSMMFHTH
jgi:zinc and cadmium transporter